MLRILLMADGERRMMNAVALACALTLLCWAGGVQSKCDFTHEMSEGQTYYMYNSEFPKNYKGAVTCRWRVAAPAGGHLKLSCSIDIPATSNCKGDRIRISLSGNDRMEDAHSYCGRGDISLTSDQEKVTAVLEAPDLSDGGSFLCKITS